MDQGNNYKHISTASTTVVGVLGQRVNLKAITINATTASTTIIYDASTSIVASSSNVVASFKPSVAEGGYFFGDHGIILSNGCIIVTLGASDITAVYSNL